MWNSRSDWQKGDDSVTLSLLAKAPGAEYVCKTAKRRGRAGKARANGTVPSTGDGIEVLEYRRVVSGSVRGWKHGRVNAHWWRWRGHMHRTSLKAGSPHGFQGRCRSVYGTGQFVRGRPGNNVMEQSVIRAPRLLIRWLDGRRAECLRLAVLLHADRPICVCRAVWLALQAEAIISMSPCAHLLGRF